MRTASYSPSCLRLSKQSCFSLVPRLCQRTVPPTRRPQPPRSAPSPRTGAKPDAFQAYAVIDSSAIVLRAGHGYGHSTPRCFFARWMAALVQTPSKATVHAMARHSRQLYNASLKSQTKKIQRPKTSIDLCAVTR